MSVAFRRESDDEHKEPRFELPIPPGPNLVTPRGLDQIAAEVARLEGAIEHAPDEAAREALRRDLRYWHTRHATAVLAPSPPPDEVGIGSRVTIRLGDAVRRIEIVGGDDADPAADRIAFSAPLARAIMGASPGDYADFNGRTEAIEVAAVDNGASG